MPALDSNHHCTRCKNRGSARKSNNGGCCPKHQTICTSDLHPRKVFIHFEDEPCKKCVKAIAEQELRLEKEAEAAAKKAQKEADKKAY